MVIKLENGCLKFEYRCSRSDACVPITQRCDGKAQCLNGEDEIGCNSRSGHPSDSEYEVNDPTLTIVMPTIAACVILVFFMLLGIQKCKQWELDQFVEMRRTRRIMERLTATLREKNVKLIQKAKTMRREKKTSIERTKDVPYGGPPPKYGVNYPLLGDTGNSPPPSYEDILLDAAADACADRLGKYEMAPYGGRNKGFGVDHSFFDEDVIPSGRRSNRVNHSRRNTPSWLPRAYSLY